MHVPTVRVRFTRGCYVGLSSPVMQSIKRPKEFRQEKKKSHLDSEKVTITALNRETTSCFFHPIILALTEECFFFLKLVILLYAVLTFIL